MRKSPRHPVKYVIGFSLVLIAVSNCFNVLSSSSSLTASPAEDVSRIEAAKRVQDSVRLGSLAGANRDRSILESIRGRAPISRADLVTRASAISPLASPFAPTITATKSHMLPPGDTQADPGDTVTYTIVISNTGSSAATGVNFSDTIDPNTTLVAGSLIASPVAVDDSYNTIGNVNISVPAGQGVIANDSNPNGSGTLTVTKVNATAVPSGGSATASTANGSVTMSSDGSFTYTPNVAFRGPTDSFGYTLGNGTGKTDTATVTITVNGLIWFVDSTAAPGGDGRLSSPFNCLVGPGCFDPAAADIANDNIFLYSGIYTGGLTLLSGQKFIGQGASQSLLTITGLSAPSGNNLLPSTGGTNPTITSTANGVDLGSNNQIWGVTFGNKIGAGISGTSFGTLTVRDTTINGTGQALNLSTGTLDAIFQSLSSTTSLSTGMTVNATAGSMSVTGATSVINVTGTGVSLTNNTGTISFSALNITNAGQKGLVATDNSNIITTTSGAITTTGATAVEITRSSGTTPLVISLTSVSANGGTDGIILTNTSGSFSVVGDGTNTRNNSGGTIQNTTNNGVTLSNVQNFSLDHLEIQSTVNSGVKGTLVTNFTYKNSTINNSGTGGGAQTSNIAFNNTVAGTENNVNGTLTITNNALTNAFFHGVSVKNFNGTLSDVNVSDNVITSSTSTATSKGQGIQFNAFGSASATASISKATINLNMVTNFPSDAGITVLGGNATEGAPSSTMGTAGNPIAITNNTISGQSAANRIGTQGILFNVNGTGSGNFNVSGNIVTHTTGNSISHNVFGDAVVASVINGNTVTSNNILASSGIAGGTSTTAGFVSNTPSLTVSITNNIVSQTDGNGILFVARDNAIGTLNISIKGNNVAAPLTGVRPGIRVDAGNSLGDNDVCLDIGGTVAADKNTTAGSGGFAGIGLRKQGTSPTTNAFGIEGMVATSSPGVEQFVDSRNNSQPAPFGDGDGVLLLSAASGFSNCATAPMSLPEVDELSTSSANPTTDGAATSAAGDQQDILRAARGEGEYDENDNELTQAELTWIVQAAISRLSLIGLSSEELARLNAMTFELADLPDSQLALATSTLVQIDKKAAGYGWFFDQTPLDDSEFDVPVPDRERQTTDLSPAHGKMDLLTVVTRQLGHIYLKDKKRVPKDLRPLMQGALSSAVRRMPVFNIRDRSTSRVSPREGQSLSGKALASGLSQLKTDSSTVPVLLMPAVFNSSADQTVGLNGRIAKRMSYAASARPVAAFSPAAFSGETVTLNIGTIPAGESVTIMFQVTIDNPFPAGVCTITNQGHVTGTNFSQVDTNIDVITMVAPVAIGACPANIMTSTDPGLCTAVVTYTTPTASGCPAATVTCNPPSGFAFPKGTTTVTCTATNGTSPDSTCTFTVEVKDTEAPTCNLPANITQNNDAGQCSAVVTYTATASDNCGSATIVCTPASGATFAVGTTTVNCTASDDSPDSPDTNCSFTVTVKDTEAPTCNLPANITQNNDSGQCSAVVTYTATASDNCPGSTISCNPASGSTFPVGTTTVNCTASDNSPDSPDTNCSFTVTVKDTQAPTMTACPSNISVTSGGGCQVVNYTPPTATDNCGTATVVCSPPSGFCFPPGTTTVTCTASDTSPDSPDTSCSFTVTVAPCAITCPSNITTGNDPGQCGATVTFAPTSSPGCGTVTCSPSSGSFFPVGTTTVTCTTSAGPGCSFTVTVTDTEAPNITTTTQPIELWPPNHQYSTVTMNQLVASATDNCGGNVIDNVVIASVSSDEPENGSDDGNTVNDIVIAANCKSVQLRAERDNGSNGRVYTIVLKATDAAGNMGTASRTVTVKLSQSGPPAILGPGPGYSVTGSCP